MDKEALVKIILEKVMEELLKIETKKDNKTKQTVNFLGEDVSFKEELSKKVDILDGLNLRSVWNDIERNSLNNKIIISTLCIDGLISIAQGKKNFVIEALLNGGEVFVIEEGIFYKKYSEPKPLIKVYDEYLGKLKSYGIKIIKKDEMIEMLSEKESVYIQGIITENKLKSMGIRNKKIIINSNNKITSLAQDYIKQNNIEVHYERGQ